MNRKKLYVGMPLELSAGGDSGRLVYVMAVEPWKHVRGLVHAPAKSKKARGVAVAIDFRDVNRSELDWRPACVPIERLYRPGEVAAMVADSKARFEKRRAEELENYHRVQRLLKDSRFIWKHNFHRKLAGEHPMEPYGIGADQVSMKTDLFESLLALYDGLPQVEVVSDDTADDSAAHTRCVHWNSLYQVFTPVLLLSNEERWPTKTRSKAFVQQGRAVIYVSEMHAVVPLDNVFTYYQTRR